LHLPNGNFASHALPHVSPDVKAFVIAQLKPDFDAKLEAVEPTRVVAAELPLADGRKDILVYITGRNWCGNGGCSLMILEPENGSYKIIGDTSITWAPIRKLATSSHGHPDIGVDVSGGGLIPGYEARLRFDGRRYPENPSVPPAIPLKSKQGVILIGDDDKGELLYP
jgi:hypothetical protein